MEVLQRTANRGSISTGPYEVDNSVKLEADNTEYLTRDPASAGDRQKFTTSMWVKRTELGQASTIFGVQPASSGSDTNTFQFGFMSDDKFQLGLQTYYVFNTNRLFRDTSAWYHIVMAVDTTQATASNRIKLYINGIQETSFAVETYPNQNHSTGVNFTEPHRIGTLLTNSWYFSGYISEVNHIDGSQLAPTSFGEFDDDSGIWKPKAYTGSYGTNGFYLDFESSGSLGADSSGNSNDFTLNNITSIDQATDTPTNNFATLNPLHLTTKYTITEGGTNQVSSADGQWGASVGSVGVTSGKWYFEVQSADTNGYTLLGVIDQDSVIGTYVNGDAHAGDAPYGITYYGAGGSIITNGSAVTGLSFPTWTTETMGCALDLDNNKIYFSKSGTYGNSGNPVTGSNGISLPTGGSGTWFISTSTLYAAYPAKTNQGGYTANSISSAASDDNGYGTFEYAPPSGYYALCTKNLAEYG